ncbi:MAG: lipopolysaccharide heptosyltransferase II [Pseudomonadota bacterium]
MSGNGARILIISPNWIGDAVMAQPLLQLLRAADPTAPIDVLAPPPVAPVWRQMAEVDSVIETPFRHGSLQLRARWTLARQLRRRRYQAAYVLPNTLKFALIPWLAGIGRRVGYKGESRYGLINVMHHDDRAAPRPMVSFYAALARPPVAVVPPEANPPRPALSVDAAQIAAARARLGLGLGQAERLIGFAPGAEFGPAKRWPESHFADLAKTVLADHPSVHIMLLGSPKDHAVCEQVLALAGPQGAGRIHNLAGQTSLQEAIALLAAADAVVANDSGLLHIASALNRPVVALYGPTDPDHAPPWSARAAALSLRLECAPCRQRVCPLGHQHCLRQLGAPMVWGALRPMLAPPAPL